MSADNMDVDGINVFLYQVNLYTVSQIAPPRLIFRVVSKREQLIFFFDTLCKFFVPVVKIFLPKSSATLFSGIYLSLDLKFYNSIAFWAPETQFSPIYIISHPTPPQLATCNNKKKKPILFSVA